MMAHVLLQMHNTSVTKKKTLLWWVKKLVEVQTFITASTGEVDRFERITNVTLEDMTNKTSTRKTRTH